MGIKKRYIYFTFLATLLWQLLPAQQFSTGMLFDNEAFEQEVELTPAFTNDGRRAGDLPLRFTLRPFCPVPQNQGEISSCIGWALGYGALTISHAYRENNTDRNAITQHAFSALYLYNQSKTGDCMSGTQVQRAAKVLKEKGNCLSSEFDFPLADCEREPDEAQVEKAKKYAIKDYVALFNNTFEGKEKVARTKRSIAEGKPVVVGLQVKESLKNLTPQNPHWQPGGAEDKPMGGHALVVVGYNNSTGEFDLMNSWGPNWADSGFFQLKYKDFAENAVQGVQLIMQEENLSDEQIAAIKAQYRQASSLKNDAAAKQQAAEVQKQAAETELKNAVAARAEDKIKAAQALVEQADQQVKVALTQQKEAEAVIAKANDRLIALSGEFVVRIPEADEYGTLLTDSAGQQKFRELHPQWNGSFYTLDKTDWQEGDMYQVVARNIKKDRYIYLFSLDGNDKLEIHWPRTLRAEMTGKPAEGAAESALVAHAGAEIVIPGEEGVLTRENLLDDNICVLYSFDKIEDIKDRLSRLTQKAGPFEDRLRRAFGDLFIPPDLIQYGRDRMDCNTESTGRGSVIPIVVRVQNL